MNRPDEAILMSTHNIHFHDYITFFSFSYIFLKYFLEISREFPNDKSYGKRVIVERERERERESLFTVFLTFVSTFDHLAICLETVVLMAAYSAGLVQFYPVYSFC